MFMGSVGPQGCSSSVAKLHDKKPEVVAAYSAEFPMHGMRAQPAT